MSAAGDQEQGPSFHELMERIRTGDQAAAWELLDTYGSYLMHVIRQNLPTRLRSKFDSTDFYQNVWASFFGQPEVFQRLDGPKDLLNYLRGMARKKLLMENRRRFQTQKYDMNKESSLDDAPPVDAHSEGAPAKKEPPDKRQSTPSQVAMVREEWDQWMSKQTLVHQKVVALRFKGLSFEQIAQELRISERTARRVIDQLKAQFGTFGDDEDRPDDLQHPSVAHPDSRPLPPVPPPADLVDGSDDIDLPGDASPSGQPPSEPPPG